MNSYQKLKRRNEYLEGQVRLFKNALTIYEAPPEPIQHEDGSITLEERIYVQRNKLFDEQIKLELQRWVAFNLDKDSIMALLELKERIENEERIKSIRDY